jgi:hypothetical protein
MSLDESWTAYRDWLRAVYGLPVTDDWPHVVAAQVEREALSEGQLRYGGPGDWFRSIRWSGPAWTALHGAEGPRGRSAVSYH